MHTCLIVLLVRKRIQCGIGRFCLAFLAKCFLILNVLYDGCGGAAMRWVLVQRSSMLLVDLCTQYPLIKVCRCRAVINGRPHARKARECCGQRCSRRTTACVYVRRATYHGDSRTLEGLYKYNGVTTRLRDSRKLGLGA